MSIVEPFRPTLRVDVYDEYEARSRGTPVKIAEIYTDRRTARFKIENARSDAQLRKLFSEPRFLFISGGTHEETDAQGVKHVVHADAGGTFQPWSREWLDDVINYHLPFYQLRGELVRLPDGKRLRLPGRAREAQSPSGAGDAVDDDSDVLTFEEALPSTGVVGGAARRPVPRGVKIFSVVLLILAVALIAPMVVSLLRR